MGDKWDFMDVFHEAYTTDDEPDDKQENRLVDLYRESNKQEKQLMNDIFITITGYSFETLCETAGIKL